VGDSEFDYNLIYSGMTGQTSHQKVLSPFDKETGVKYPYKIDSSVSGTTYGIPIQQSEVDTIRNVMGPAGFVSDFYEYESCTGSTKVNCETQTISITALTGGSTLDVLTGSTYVNCQYITIVFDDFTCATPSITGNSSSLIYKIESVSGDTLNLDRPTPDFSGLSGNIQVLCNKCELEFPDDPVEGCIPNPVDPMGQQNPWTLNIVWDKKPIGADVGGFNQELSGYTSNRYVSTKEFLGYTSTGQTFENLIGEKISDFSSSKVGTGFINSFNELNEVMPSEQRTIAIIHYSELGDLVNDPERFFKYDDYISYDNGDLFSLTQDREGNSTTDTEYFEVYIPFIYYHRNTGTTYGALFYMDNTDYYVRSTKNERHELLFRYLIDEQGIKVGKVFPKNKIIVFDDQELVAVLDSRSNRRYTLGAPKVTAVPNNDNPIISGTTGQTFYVTYMLAESSTSSPLNTLPSNYYVKLSINNTEDASYQTVTYPSNINVRFSGSTFNFFDDAGFLSDLKPQRFYILIQETTDNTNRLPNPDEWKIIDYTAEAGGASLSGLTAGTTFTITKSD
jgi:hypothetical protein